jgi:flagellar capping protein FliD
MASSISSIDSLMTNLAPTFQTTIKAIIEAESAPLNQVKAQKDSLELRRGVFNDLKTNFDSLQNALKALISTEASYGLKMTPKLSVAPALAGSAVATASLSAETAPTAD